MSLLPPSAQRTADRRPAPAAVQHRATGPGWLPGFLALSVVWGASFALIKVAVGAGVAPGWVAFWRCALGAASLCAVCLVRRERPPRNPRTWAHALVVAGLLNTVPFTVLAFGETRVSSVLAGLLNATTPLTTLGFALLLVPGERLTARRVTGLLLGFAGVLVVLGVWRGLPGGSLLGALACLAATACYGAGFSYTRRFFADRRTPAATLCAMQMCCATAELAIVAPATGGAPQWPGWGAAGALTVLGVLGTGVAYIVNLGIIRAAGPTVAATVTYVMPVCSTLLGTVLLAEPFGWNLVAGGAVVLAGVVLTQASSRRRRVATDRAAHSSRSAG